LVLRAARFEFRNPVRQDGKHSAPPRQRQSAAGSQNPGLPLAGQTSPQGSDRVSLPACHLPLNHPTSRQSTRSTPGWPTAVGQTTWRGPRPSPALAWVLLLVVFGGSVAAAMFERPNATAGSRLDGDVIFEVQAKQLYLVGALGSPSDLPPGTLAGLRKSATTPGMAWRVVAILSVIDRDPGAVHTELLPMVEKFDDEIATLGGDAQTLHEAVKAALVAPDQIAPDQRQRLIDHLGWFGYVLVTHAAGSQNPDRIAAERPAYRVMWVGLLALVGGGVALLAGTVLFLWKLVTHLKKYGEVRIAMHQSQVPAAIYLEAVAIYLGIALAARVALGFIPGLGDSMVLSLGLLTVASVTGVAWPFIRSRSAAEVRGDLGLTRGRGIWREIGAGIVGYLTILPIFLVGALMTLMLLIVYLLLARENGGLAGGWDGPVAPHPVFQWIAQSSAIGKVLVLLLASAFAPFFEETMFRGALLNGAARTIRLAPAIVVMAFMFAVIHPQGWVAVPALMSLAIGFALIRLWRRGCLVSSMTAHALHNGILVLLMILLFG